LKRKALIVGAGIGLLAIAVLAFLLLTGERGLSSRSEPARVLDVTRLGVAETEAAGWSPTGLDAVFVHASTLSTDTLMIVTKGQTVAAFGDLETPHATHSIRKALLSALVGQHIGSGEGQIRLDATLQELGIDDAPNSLSELQKQATVEHLLRSMSGINLPATADGGLRAEKDRLLGRGENAPGTIWAYNNWDYNALTTIFETQTGMGVAEAFQTGFARPAGMRDFDVDDVSYISDPTVSRHRSAAFRMSARDLAMFGQIYLDRGQMNGQQIVPAPWVDRITANVARTGRDDLRWGHGYLWWVPAPDAGLPEGSFWAWGLGNQAVLVIPAWDSVIVHQSDTTEFLKRFIPMITSGEQPGEEAIEQLILWCIDRTNRETEFCREHRFTTRREFEKLVAFIADARL